MSCSNSCLVQVWSSSAVELHGILTLSKNRARHAPDASATSAMPWNLCRGVYSQAEPGFSGRCTAPLLLDRRSRRIISNESEDIVRLLNGLHLPGCPDTDLRGPADQLPAIQQLCDTIYNTVLPELGGLAAARLVGAED